MQTYLSEQEVIEYVDGGCWAKTRLQSWLSPFWSFLRIEGAERKSVEVTLGYHTSFKYLQIIWIIFKFV
jgi:hypothetical protein